MMNSDVILLKAVEKVYTLNCC